jgi:hypothetical protein
MQSFSAAHYRALADEMRVIASRASHEMRQGYLNAAANYDRVAETVRLRDTEGHFGLSAS